MLPMNLILRCYGYKTRRNTWLLVCIDLALAVEEDTLEAAKAEMRAEVRSYVEAVFDTDDPSSIPHLLHRRAPFKDFLHYYWVKFLCKLTCPRDQLSLDEPLPVQLSFA